MATSYFGTIPAAASSWDPNAAKEAAQGAPIAPHLRTFALAYIEAHQKK